MLLLDKKNLKHQYLHRFTYSSSYNITYIYRLFYILKQNLFKCYVPSTQYPKMSCY